LLGEKKELIAEENLHLRKNQRVTKLPVNNHGVQVGKKANEKKKSSKNEGEIERGSKDNPCKQGKRGRGGSHEVW